MAKTDILVVNEVEAAFYCKTEIDSLDKAKEEIKKTAEKYGLGYKFVYKMCFFNEKYTLKQSGQPADLVKFKDMVKIIDINIDVLLKEFDDYEKCRNSLTANTK